MNVHTVQKPDEADYGARRFIFQVLFYCYGIRRKVEGSTHPDLSHNNIQYNFRSIKHPLPVITLRQSELTHLFAPLMMQ